MASILTNAQDFRFKDIELHGSTEGWEDDLPIRLAQYEYLKRDGGEQEPMGAGVKAFTFRCIFMGPDCGRRYQSLAASVQKEPRGQLVHPRLGTFNVACRGIKGRESPAFAIDTIEFTIEFVENQVDQSIQGDTQFGPQKRASQVSDAIDQAATAANRIVANRIANQVYAAAVAAVTTMNQWAEKFRALSLEIAQSDTPDTSLSKLLANVLEKRDLALVALDATLTKTLEPSVALTDARTACYIAYAACVQLYQAVLAQKPPIVFYTVPTAQPLNQILVRIYGAGAKAKRPEAFLLNRIPTPHWIPAGVVLRFVSPVVQQ